MELIETVTVGSGGAASITFSSIPQTYTDLCLLISWRSTATNAVDLGGFHFNGDTGANYEFKILVMGGTGAAGSATNSNYLAQYNNWSLVFQVPNSFTANTFANHSVYLPNYSTTGSYKRVNAEVVTENNSTSSYCQIGAGYWRNNSAINSINFTSYGGSWVEGSSISLYGILKGSDGVTTVS